MLQIEILNGSETGQLLSLPLGTTTLGRRKDCDLPLNSTAVSGRHLELKVSDSGTVHFRDLGSTNGTWVGGMKVQEGEWADGVTLKLGDLELRLLSGDAPKSTPAAPIVVESADDEVEFDAGASQVARAEAMSAKRKGGPLLIFSMVAAIAAGGAWWFFQVPAPSSDGATHPRAAKGPQVVLDAIDNLGDFNEDVAGDWSLPDKVKLVDGQLRQSGGQHRVALARQFDLTGGGLAIQADVVGLRVTPVIGWGTRASDSPIAWWQAESLTSTGIELALPEQAEWFELAFLLDGAGSLGAVGVESIESQATVTTAGDRKFTHSGGNMILSRTGRELLHARGNGIWSATEAGLHWQATSPDGSSSVSELWLRFTDRILDTGPLVILADGGPIEATPSLLVDATPGLFVGVDAQRMIMRWGEPARVSAVEGGVKVQATQASLVWDLRAELGAAAKADRAVRNAVRDQQSAVLLAASATLLRDYPFSSKHAEYAKASVDRAIQEGRATLSVLQTSSDEATFLRSVREMNQLEANARQLSDDFPGTTLANDAVLLADALQSDASVISAEKEAVRQRWRERLKGVLNRTYPFMGAWLNNQENQS